jgi:hypothetical protein
VQEWQNRGFSSHFANDEITACGYRALTFAKSTTIVIAELTVMSGQGSSQDELVLGVKWFG